LWSTSCRSSRSLRDVYSLPAWVDIPPPTHEQLNVEASAKKNQLRAAADTEIEWRQDAVDADIATEEEAATLAASKKYRVLLMRIDTSKAPDISWPEKPFWTTGGDGSA